jgi:hypothetical protein
MEPEMSAIWKAPRRYFIEFNSAMVLYLVTVIGREHAFEVAAGSPALKTLILISPILPVLLAAVAVVRFYRRIDEYHRLQMLESLAIAAGATGVIATSWTFLEDVGLPHLALFWAWPIIGAVWAIVAMWLGWKDKGSEGAAWRTLRSVAAMLTYVAVGTAIAAGIGLAFAAPLAWYWLALVASVLFIARMGFFIFSKTKSC